LVGGTAVEFDTARQCTSGDFDFVTSSDQAFMDALQGAGFSQDKRPGRMQRQVLSGTIDWDKLGFWLPIRRTDRKRLRDVKLVDGEIVMPPGEDMIADRIGQWDTSNRRDETLLAQARAM